MARKLKTANAQAKAAQPATARTRQYQETAASELQRQAQERLF